MSGWGAYPDRGVFIWAKSVFLCVMACVDDLLFWEHSCWRDTSVSVNVNECFAWMFVLCHSHGNLHAGLEIRSA